MRKRFIYICSPCKGDMEKNIAKAQGYCREAAQEWPDVVPIAPHVYCTQFLDDTIQEERETGLNMGLALLDMCDEIWVYGIDNPSEGMAREIEYATEHGIPVWDAADVYRDRRHQERDNQGENWDKEAGEVLLQLPSENGAEAVTVKIGAELIEELAKQLRRNKGQDITVEVE